MAGWFWFGVSHESRCWLGPLLTEGLTRPEGSASTMAHFSAGKIVLTASRGPSSSQCGWLCNSFTARCLSFSRIDNPREKKAESAMSFQTWPWKALSSFPDYLNHTGHLSSVQGWRELHKGMNTNNH